MQNGCGLAQSPKTGWQNNKGGGRGGEWDTELLVWVEARLPLCPRSESEVLLESWKLWHASNLKTCWSPMNFLEFSKSSNEAKIYRVEVEGTTLIISWVQIWLTIANDHTHPNHSYYMNSFTLAPEVGHLLRLTSGNINATQPGDCRVTTPNPTP